MARVTLSRNGEAGPINGQRPSRVDIRREIEGATIAVYIPDLKDPHTVPPLLVWLELEDEQLAQLLAPASVDPVELGERHSQVLTECERLINRNAVLEARLGEARIWQSSVKGTLETLLQAPDIARGHDEVPAKTNGLV